MGWGAKGDPLRHRWQPTGAILPLGFGFLQGSDWRSPFDDAACVCGATHALPQRVGRGPDPHTEAKNVFARAYFFSEIEGSGLLLTESIRAHFGKNTWLTFSPPSPSPQCKVECPARLGKKPAQ